MGNQSDAAEEISSIADSNPQNTQASSEDGMSVTDTGGNVVQMGVDENEIQKNDPKSE